MDYHEKDDISLYLNSLILIEQIESCHQLIILYKHPQLGKVLIINDEIQHVENYQCFYHEMLVHLPIAFIPNIRTALIIGGGSLFAAYELLKYSSIIKVVLCDYDHEVINLMKRNYEHAKKVLNDPRFLYVEQEGLSYILSEKSKYDLIINDCFNLAFLSGEKGQSMYRLMTNLCTSQGLCVDIIYRHIFDKKITLDTLNYLKSENNTVLSLVTVPEYPGVLHIETIWGNSPYLSPYAKTSVNQEQLKMLSGEIALNFQFFSPKYLPYYLYVPPYINNMFNL